MPTYHCTSPAGLLDAGKKSAIAKEITRIHNAVTGAAAFFAQVIFTDVAKGNHFMGGAPLASDQIFVHGFIRAGRSVPDRERLVTEMATALAGITGLPKKFVWVYVTEIPARQMANMAISFPSRAMRRPGWTDFPQKIGPICSQLANRKFIAGKNTAPL